MNLYKVVIYLVGLFVVSLFFGYLPAIVYDDTMQNWQLIRSLILLVGLVIYLIDISSHHQNRIKLPTRYHTYGLVALAIAMSVSTWFAINPFASLGFQVIIMALPIFCYSCYLAIRERPAELEVCYFFIALAPLMTVVWIPPAYYWNITRGWDMQWHGAFTNVRYYNDILLPIIFVLWYQPKWLRHQSKWVLLMSIAYVYSLWLDGARAALLSMACALGFGLWVLRHQPKVAVRFLSIPVLSIVISWLIFYTIELLNLNNYIRIEDSTAIPISRDTSSWQIRWHMWLEAWQAWLQSPIFGIGGYNEIYHGRTLAQEGGSPHNIIVQQVLSWGIAGIVLVVIMLFYMIKLLRFCAHDINIAGVNSVFIRERQLFIYMAVLAALINMVFSSSSTYPYVQIFVSLLIAHVFVVYYASHGNQANQNAYLPRVGNTS